MQALGLIGQWDQRQTNIIRCYFLHIHISQRLDNVVLHIGGVALQCSRRHFCGLHQQPLLTILGHSRMLPVEDDLRYLASRLLLFIVQFLAGSPIQAHLLAVCVQNPGSGIQDTLSCDGSILRYVFFLLCHN